METSFLELKQKEVVNLCDGKCLGKVSDVVFSYPEGRVFGIVVPGSRGFHFRRADLFIDIKNIGKIGVDVILVDVRTAPKAEQRRGKERCFPTREGQGERRDFGEYE